jgi:streptomycin 6-kinase
LPGEDRNVTDRPSAGEAFDPEVEALLKAWDARPDGNLVTTRSSWVLPVLRNGVPAVLKAARTADEQHGYELMRWWAGDGAARVLASAENALLLERATGSRNLADMARGGQDDEACEILCETGERLHAKASRSMPDLHPLEIWFQPLFNLASQHPRLAKASVAARQLLSEPRCVSTLHGDLHHENVLDFGERGWLAIDPHGLIGERFFDFANIFTNPDLSDPGRPVGTAPGRLERRLRIVVETTRVEADRMLLWIVAWTGLSAAWFMEDGDDTGVAIDLTINEIACGLAEL